MESDKSSEKWSPRHLYYAVFAINILHVTSGCVTVWTSPTLPKLDNILTKDQQSLIGSLFTFGAALGPVVTALTLDTLGRKKTFYILALCYLTSWVILASSYNPYSMYIGRIISGIGLGGTFAANAVFIGEISDNKRRNSLCSYSMLFVDVGCIIEYCIGPYVSYVMLIVASASVTILFFILFYIIPESPHFLLAKGSTFHATEAFRWYRGGADLQQTQAEFDEIKESIKNQKQGSLRTLMRDKGSRKALGISIFLLAMQQATGMLAVLAFSQTIFEKANINFSPAIGSMIVGFANLFSTIPAPFIVQKFGLKKSVIISGFTTTFFQGVMSLYFYADSIMSNSSSIGFIPVVALILGHFSCAAGLGPCPWAFVAEAFSLEVRGIAASICGVCSSLIGFITSTAFGFALYYTSPAIVFGAFATMLGIFSILSIFIVPNTKGKTLKEIQDCFSDKKQTFE